MNFVFRKWLCFANNIVAITLVYYILEYINQALQKKRYFMKRKKILTKVTALMLSFAVILSSNITYAEIYGYNENVEYFLPYDNYNNIIINDVSEDEMEQIRKAAEINQELIKESLSTKNM